VLVEATSDEAALAPSLRYAYFREDPERNRVHVRFTDYWNPCVADAQLQNQLRTDPAPASQAAAYRALLPRRAWTADVYLHLDTWPTTVQRGVELEVRSIDEVGGPVDQNALTCLLRRCPYEAECDACLPTTGAIAGFSRATDHLPAAYFEDDSDEVRVQQYASSGVVRLDVWNPVTLLAPSAVGSDDSGLGFAPTAQLSGTADLTLREVGQAADAGRVQIQFNVAACEPMQAAFTPEIASFVEADLNGYGPPACGVVEPRAAPYGLALLGLALFRRRRSATGSRPSSAHGVTGAVAQPVCSTGSTSSSPTAKI